MRRRMNYGELNALQREGKYTELIQGCFYNHPAPSHRHQRILYNLVREVGFKIEGHGIVLFAPFDVILSSSDVLQPDFVFVSKKNLRRITDRGLEGIPDLVIEVISTADEKYDTVNKKSVYQTYGVKHVWFVHPEKKTIEILELRGPNYIVRAVHTKEASFISRIFPDIRFNCSRIFRGV